jgi:uncharacterized protein (TIGR02145 family)
MMIELRTFRVRFPWVKCITLAAVAFLPVGCEKADDVDNESPLSTLSDYDGNSYYTTKIGDQWWMASNLKTTHFADGSDILLVEGISDWDTLAAETKAYCYYNNDGNTEAFTFGALYTWAAALNGAESLDNNPSGIQGVCPDGWHMPSDSEWKELEMHLGMTQVDSDTTGPRGLYVGSKLAVSKDLWSDGTLKNNNEFGTSGFMALPGGGRRYDGTFGNVGENANFWSATESNEAKAWSRHIYSEYSTVHRYRSVKSDGFSVRCVKDD